MSEQAPLQAPAPPSPPGDEAAKLQKKKDKARKQWITFWARVAAQVVGAAASVALGVFLVQRSQQPREAAAPVEAAPAVRVDTSKEQGEVALAVLPLSNFSADASQEYFADGMHEALTAELAMTEGLHVISRTSTMRYKTERKSLPQVARELGVDFIVEGSVVKTPERVRVTAQLIDAKTDEHVWARSYERTLKDILLLQSEVATAIAGEVKGVLAPSRPARPRRAIDPVVYDLYLRGRHAWSLRTQEGFDSAIRYFTDATRRDPQFALAYAGLADAFSLFPTASLVNRSVNNYERARAAAEKAIALDDTLAEAHTSLGAVYFFGDRNFAAAAKEFQRALELNPHYPTAQQWYAIALSEHGRHREALEHAQEAVKQDPLNGVMHQALGLVHYYARTFDKAAAAERQALQLNPQLPLARVVLAKSLILDGKPDEAIKVCEAAAPPRGLDMLLTQGIAHARAGNRAAAETIFNDLNSRQPRPTGVLMQWHAATGNYDAAFELMKTQPAPPAVLNVDPLFDGLRADRRFTPLTGTR